MSDRMVGCLGSTMSIGVSELPLGAHGPPEQGDWFSGPYCSCGMAPVELEFSVVAFEEAFLEAAPISDQSTFL
jgi:hypothetical protein